MYIQLYFHKTTVACEAMLQKISENISWSFPANIEEYTQIDEYNILSVLQEAINKKEESKNQKDTKELLFNLLKHRLIWKRVFEISTLKKSETSLKLIKEAETILREQNIEFKTVRSVNYLRNKKKSPLRLIRKDYRQFLCVKKLDNYSTLFKNDQLVEITRIYTPENPTVLKKLLFERFETLQLPH